MPYFPPAGFGGGSGVDQTARDAASTAQATANALVPGTRTAAYPLGGCENADGGWNGATVMTTRERVTLPVKPIDMRIHVLNRVMQNDSLPTAVPLTGLTAAIGPVSGGSGFNYATAPQVFGPGNGASVVGDTDWVSDWLTPVSDLTTPHALSVQFSMPANTPLALGNAKRQVMINAAAVSTLSVGTLQTSGPATTTWFDGAFGVLEIWIEYRYKDVALGQGMVIGHSLPDGCNYNGLAANVGWDGHETSWVNQAARKNRQPIVSNCCANVKLTSWGNSSKKWLRFADEVFDWIIIELAGNDILASTSTGDAATIDTNLRAVIAKAKSVWPAADIYVPTAMPIKPNDTSAAAATHETNRTTFNTNLGKLLGEGLITGILDFERAIASASDYTTLDLRTQDTGAAATRHANPYGHGLLADQVNILGRI